MRLTLLFCVLLGWGCADGEHGGAPFVEKGEGASETVLLQANAALDTNQPPESREQDQEEQETIPDEPQDRTGENDPEFGDDVNPERFDPQQD